MEIWLIIFGTAVLLLTHCAPVPLEQRLIQHLQDAFDHTDACQYDLENTTLRLAIYWTLDKDCSKKEL